MARADEIIACCWWWATIMYSFTETDLANLEVTARDVTFMRWFRERGGVRAWKVAMAAFLRYALAHVCIKADMSTGALEEFVEMLAECGAAPRTFYMHNLRCMKSWHVLYAANVVHLPRCISVPAGMQLRHVRSLDLYNCMDITDAELAYMMDLAYLRLGCAKGVTDHGLRGCAELREVVLGVEMEHITDAAFSGLCLEKLVLLNHGHISERVLPVTLEYLEVHQNSELLLSYMLPALPRLRALVIPHHIYMNAYVHSCYPHIEHVVSMNYVC